MEAPVHDFSELFAQLGLAADAAAIDAFLREELAEDADWAELVDQLDAALRAPH